MENLPSENRPSSNSDAVTLDIFQSGQGQNEEDVVLEGQMSGTNPSSSSRPGLGDPGMGFNTLDEPIMDTIYRDVSAVGQKFYHVLYPKEKTSLLKDWDLWGPLLLCTFMAVILQGHDTNSAHKGDQGDGGPEFAEVFVIVWIGALIVTLNIKLLGGNISFFQSVCVLGYCLLPLTGSLVICRFVLLFSSGHSSFLFLVRAISVLLGFVWASYASMQFLGECQPEKRKALAAYPMALFYFVIAWMVISHSN